jgi:hypothetical protein
MRLKTRALIALIVLSIVDVVVPIPIVGIILIFVALHKPPWFRDLVCEVYET